MNTLLATSPFGPWGTFLVVFLGSVFVLYLARTPAHKAIRSLFYMLATAMRMSAAAINSTRDKLKQRNLDVLLGQGQEQVARDLEKEFFEISRFVQRDLGGYPQLQREIQELVAKIEDDYNSSGVVDPAMPEWVEAVEAVSKLKSSDKAALNSKVLEQIVKSAEQQHKEITSLQRQESSMRHKVLKAMTPYWRKLSDSVDEVGVRLKEIVTRSENIDAHMRKFNEINNGTDAAVRALKISSITQFLIAALVITIAIGGAFFNFHLIALPMSEMVGSVQRIGGVKVADLAALVIICLEMTAGIFLLESLRITKLFPLIGSMDDRMRRIIMISSAVVLLVLASTESALAFMRDQIAVDLANLRASLAGAEVENTGVSGINEWIPLAANMILGFILPLALTMIAIPLEYLLQTGRTVVGGLLEIVMGFISVVLRLISNALRHLGKITISLYDLLIAGPIWIETLVEKRRQREDYRYQEPDFIDGSNK